jgi:predicted PurR-regulated permease PerM
MRRLAWYTLLVLLTLSALILLWELRQALVLFVLSLAVAAAFRPLVDFLAARKLPRGLALALAYILVLSVIAGLLVAIGGPLIRDLQQAAEDFSSAYTRIVAEWPQSNSLFQSTLAGQLPDPESLSEALMGERGLSVGQAVLGIASGFFGVLTSVVIIIILSIYWSADRVYFERLWLSLLPVKQRARAREIWREIEQGVGAYIASEALQSLLAGVLLWLGYSSMGLQYPALLAVIGAIAWLIPWLGAVLAVIPPLLVGLGISNGIAALAVIYTLMVLFVMEVVVEPRFFQRQRYSSLLLVLVAMALALVAGLLGVILAPPLAAAIQIAFNHYTELRTLRSPAGDQGSMPFSEDVIRQLDAINARLADFKQSVEEEQEITTPESISLLQRLDRLVNQTNSLVGKSGGDG